MPKGELSKAAKIGKATNAQARWAEDGKKGKPQKKGA